MTIVVMVVSHLYHFTVLPLCFSTALMYAMTCAIKRKAIISLLAHLQQNAKITVEVNLEIFYGIAMERKKTLWKGWNEQFAALIWDNAMNKQNDKHIQPMSYCCFWTRIVEFFNPYPIFFQIVDFLCG